MLAERSVYFQVKAWIDGKDCSMMQSAYVDCTETCVLKLNGKNRQKILAANCYRYGWVHQRWSANARVDYFEVMRWDSLSWWGYRWDCLVFFWSLLVSLLQHPLHDSISIHIHAYFSHVYRVFLLKTVYICQPKLKRTSWITSYVVFLKTN